jgi:hypothetical protein
MKIALIVIIALLGSVACGVRGDPVPPKIPAELGRGQPTYKGATEDLAFPTVPPVYAPSTKALKEKDKKDSKNEKK